MTRKLAAWQGYGVALFLSVGAVLASLALRAVVTPIPGVLMIPAILAAAWFGGLGPGLVACLVSAVALDYFFITPANPAGPRSMTDALGLGVYVGIAIAISLAATRRREAIDQARQAVDELRTAHARAERTSAQLAQVQAVTARLSAALTADEVAGVILAHALPALGASSGAIARLAGDEVEVVSDIGSAEGLLGARRRFPLAALPPMADVIRSRALLLLPSREAALERYPTLAPQLVRYHAFAVVPLAVNDHVLGAMIFAFEQARAFTREDEALLQTLGQQLAQALQRAQLYEAEQQARLRSDRLAEVTTALSQALSPDQVTAVILHQGAAAVGAWAATVLLLSEDGRELVKAATIGYPSATQQRFLRLPVDSSLPSAEAFRTGQPVWIESAAVFRERYPHLEAPITAVPSEAAAAVPLTYSGRTIGVLALSFPQARPFEADTLTYITTLAGACAQALERARLYSELDERVQARTAELRAANAALEGQVAERERAQTQLRQTVEQLRALATDLQMAREEERQRLARELHDELGGALTALKMTAHRLGRAPAVAEAGAHDLLNDIAEQIDGMVRLVRQLSIELRPAMLDDLGLVTALEAQVQEFQARSGLACTFASEVAEAPLTADQGIAVFRVLQESLTNIARHAQASQVTVSLTAEPTCLVLAVHDNGRGFDLEAAARQGRLGLTGMRERVYALAGELALATAPGQGTTVTVRVPLAGTRPQ